MLTFTLKGFKDIKMTETNEQNVLEKLQEIHERERPTVLPGAKSVYWCSAWFTPRQEEQITTMYAEAVKNPSLSYFAVPLLGQHEGLNPFVDNMDDDSPEMKDWATHTFLNDLSNMDNTDIVIAILDAEELDQGCAWEIGASYYNHKPVVAVVFGDTYEHPINLMVEESITRFIKPEELATFDFRKILKNDYQGKFI